MARSHLPHPISRDSAIGGIEIDRSLRVDQGTTNVSDGSYYYRTFSGGNLISDAAAYILILVVFLSAGAKNGHPQIWS